MPNNVKQKLRITNWEDSEKLSQIKSKIFNNKNELDFNKIIPQPDNIFNGNLGRDEKEMCKKEGRPTWYDWNRENWGTKWGAYGFKILDDDSDVICFEFQTAWNSPEPIIKKILDFAKGSIVQYLAVDEGGWFVTSIYMDEDGEITEKDLKEYCNEFQFAID